MQEPGETRISAASHIKQQLTFLFGHKLSHITGIHWENELSQKNYKMSKYVPEQTRPISEQIPALESITGTTKEKANTASVSTLCLAYTTSYEYFTKLHWLKRLLQMS
jgi:hypothetical protein